MKKLLLFVFTLTSTLCFSQTYDLKTVKEVKFFGVDYSLVKVYEATETAEQFRDAFEAINGLFIAEQKKYDVAPFLGKGVIEISINEVNKKNKNIDLSDLFTTEKHLRLTKEDLQRAVKALNINPEQGVGVVFIGDILNKISGMGHYHIVFFDMENNEIIDTWQGKGTSGGFGLRNFWASTVYKMIKSNQIKY